MKSQVVWLAIVVIVFVLARVSAPERVDAGASCNLAELQSTVDVIREQMLSIDPDLETELNVEYAYLLGEEYLDYAVMCGYQPNPEQVQRRIDTVLGLAPLSVIINAASIGSDVDVALSELDSVRGDSFTGQLLYNGVENALDGAISGCAGCHNVPETAPPLEGTYTRVVEERLSLPEFADYDVERYLVESILHPQGFIVPEYENVAMPANYGGRLTAQQLADLIAFLESQDQELE